MSSVAYPRYQFFMNGTLLPDAIVFSIDIDTSAHAQCGHFSADVSLNSNPNYPIDYWDNLMTTGNVRVEIKLSLDDKSFQTMFVGEIDEFESDITEGKARISGRDLAKKLVDTKVQTKTYQNLSCKDVFNSLAVSQGLKLIISGVNEFTQLMNQPFGRTYQDIVSQTAFSQNSKSTTLWDFMHEIARKNGAVVHLKGTELHVKSSTGQTKPAFSAYWRKGPVSNVIDLKLQRSATLAKGICVTTCSYDSANKKGFSKTTQTKQGTAIYKFVKPNMQEDDAQDYSDQMHKQIAAHERYINFQIPGELHLTPNDIVSLQGDVASWAQSYYIDSINRRIDCKGGFKQTIHAKNSSPDNKADDAEESD